MCSKHSQLINDHQRKTRMASTWKWTQYWLFSQLCESEMDGDKASSKARRLCEEILIKNESSVSRSRLKIEAANEEHWNDRKLNNRQRNAFDFRYKSEAYLMGSICARHVPYAQQASERTSSKPQSLNSTAFHFILAQWRAIIGEKFALFLSQAFTW